jgi:hypothetical protein
MANIDGPKYTGPVTFDLTDVQPDLVDVPPGGLKGARSEQEGMDKVVEELAQAVPGSGDAADVPPQAYQRFTYRTILLSKLRAHEIALAKALEVCMETRVKTENDREDDVSVIVKAVQGAAARKKDPGIAAPFEATIKYNGQIAEKAAHTRRKNAEAKGEEEGAPPPA